VRFGGNVGEDRDHGHPDRGDLEDKGLHEALKRFDLVPAPGEWINQTWIGRNGEAEMGVVDLVTSAGRHTLLVGMKPSEEPVVRWDDPDYEALQAIVHGSRRCQGHGPSARSATRPKVGDCRSRRRQGSPPGTSIV